MTVKESLMGHRAPKKWGTRRSKTNVGDQGCSDEVDEGKLAD